MPPMASEEFDRIVVLDFETTGLGPTARAVEVAWIEVDRDLRETGRVASLVDPGMPIDPGATDVHGITDEMVAGAPTLEHVIRADHGDPFAAGRTLVVAHNAAFDLPFVAPYCDEVDSLCTMRLARYLYPELRNHRLQTVCEHVGVPLGEAHRALGDVEMCLALARSMADECGGLDGLLECSEVALREMRMPFGKHRGALISELPSSYVRWMRETIGDLDGDLAACLDLFH